MTDQSKITALPSTAGIKDVATRAYLDALSNAWAARSGNIKGVEGKRFITQDEFNGMATKAVVKAFSGALGTSLEGAPTTNPDAQAINDALDNLSNWIRQSLLYQLLGQFIPRIDYEAAQALVDAALRDAKAAIVRNTVISDGLIEDTEVLATRVDDAEAAIVTQRTLSVNRDQAMVSAIQTMWTKMGNGVTSISQSGDIVTSTISVATASKWNAIEAAVTDPATGNVNAASLRQQMDTYANAINGRMAATYTVRAQISVGGQTVVGGFGLTATTGAGGIGGPDAIGPNIAFGVRADTFFVAATSATPSDAAQLAGPTEVPFIVLTSPQVINGVTYPPGVWMRQAVIGAAQIGTANIADAQITTAKIGNLQVDTLQIAGNAVTIPAVSQGGIFSFSAGSATTPQTVVSQTLVYGAYAPGSTLITVSGQAYHNSGTNPSTAYLTLKVNGSSIVTSAHSMGDQWGMGISMSAIVTGLGTGSHSVEVIGAWQQAGVNGTIRDVIVSCMGVKR